MNWYDIVFRPMYPVPDMLFHPCVRASLSTQEAETFVDHNSELHLWTMVTFTFHRQKSWFPRVIPSFGTVQHSNAISVFPVCYSIKLNFKSVLKCRFKQCRCSKTTYFSLNSSFFNGVGEPVGDQNKTRQRSCEEFTCNLQPLGALL